MSSISIREVSPRQAHVLARRADYFSPPAERDGSLWMAGCLGGQLLSRRSCFYFYLKGTLQET